MLNTHARSAPGCPQEEEEEKREEEESRPSPAVSNGVNAGGGGWCTQAASPMSVERPAGMASLGQGRGRSGEDVRGERYWGQRFFREGNTVSYTHLTLPTILLV